MPRSLDKANEVRLEYLAEPVIRITTMIYESQEEWLEKKSKELGKPKAELIREGIKALQKKLGS